MALSELDRILHQLIESIAVILGWTQLTMESLPDDAFQREYLQRVKQAALKWDHVLR